ncbi:MAG: hypothetical protein WAL24_14235 [Nitrososphaeraceae archaeon]
MIDMRVQGYKLGLIPNIKAAANAKGDLLGKDIGHMLEPSGYNESID